MSFNPSEVLLGVKNSIKDHLFGAKKSKPKKKDALSTKKLVAKPRAKSLIGTNKKNSPNITRTDIVIRRVEDIGAYNKVISTTKKGVLSDGRGIKVSEEISKNYLVIESLDRKTATILCNEKQMALAVDNTYLALIKNCNELGYATEKHYVTQNIINILNSKGDTSKISDVDSDEGPIHQAIYALIASAKKKGTSDIHIEVRKVTANIYFRINSDREHQDEIPTSEAELIARIAYQSFCSNQDIEFNPSHPQDAMMEVVTGGETTYVRLGTIKEADGFDMSLRILSGSAKKVEYKSLLSLGYSEEQQFLIKMASAIPIGVIIVSGVTNSGKTTTLTTLIGNKSLAFKNKIKIITIENPVENKLPNITQVPITTKANEDGKSIFAAYMKAALRQDPDVLMPGEIRDIESAELLVGATQSGHQVLTTLHAPSGIEAVNRLRELGVNSSVIGSSDFLAAMIHQTLVRINCHHCSLSLNEYIELKNDLEAVQLVKRIRNVESSVANYNIERVRFENPNGCIKCNHRGVEGIEVIAEVIVPDAAMKSMFRQGQDIEATKYYKESGGKLLINHGLDKMFDGRIDPSFLERKVGMLDMSEITIKDLLKQARGEDENALDLEDIQSIKSHMPLGEDNNLKSSINLKKSDRKGLVTEIASHLPSNQK